MPKEQRHLEVFLCHARSDQAAVRELYRCLVRDGVHAWLDREKLLPGQDWELEIRKAVRAADVVIICLSRQFDQAGFRQKEMRLVLDAAMEKPEGEIFIIPLRLEECDMPQSLHRWQWVDLFENDGYKKLLQALQKRAEDIGAVLQIQKSWLPRNTAPRLKVKELPVAPYKNKSAEATKHADRGEVQKPGTPAKATAPQSSSKTNPAIVAAVIGAVGTVAAALITLFANLPVAPRETPTPTATLTATATNTASPTFTLAPSEPTFTSLPATDTPIPTATPVPPVALGKDWVAGCISTLWRPYPSDVPVTDRQDGCWREPVHVFSAENGDLDFLAEYKKRPVETYGLFAPLPESGTVIFTVRLKELDNVDLWMGVFAEPDVNSRGLLMVIPTGDVKKRVFVQKSAPEFKMLASTSMLLQGNGYSISFSFTENSVRSRINPSVFVTNSVSVPSSQKWLFLGYKGLGGSYRVEGTFLSFELK